MLTRPEISTSTILPLGKQNWQRFREGFLLFCGSTVAVWLLFYSLYPFVRNGAETIAVAKTAYLDSHAIFSPRSRARVLAFGNSKTLAGFNPAIYDQAVGEGTESFNAGRPGNNRFLDFLKPILASGTRPTHILVLTPPTDESDLTWRDYWRHDNLLANLLFPFRYFPRDLVLFLASSRRGGGIVATYQKNVDTTARVIAERGYYFIEGQSHFAGDRLPDDYQLPTDSPNIVPPRIIDPDAPAFKELVALSATYGFKVIFVPTPYRTGEVAPPEPMGADVVTALPTVPGFYVAGPARWLFEPSDYSDPIHLNREGAALYSRRLAEITAPIINREH